MSLLEIKKISNFHALFPSSFDFYLTAAVMVHRRDKQGQTKKTSMFSVVTYEPPVNLTLGGSRRVQILTVSWNFKLFHMHMSR